MTHYVSRTCTEIDKKSSRDESESPSRPLEDFRETEAYVLLGAPGAGKTVAFKQEAVQCPDGYYVTARDFNTFDDKPEWRDTTLFIDGLDEMRAGSTDGRTPLDRIRNNLNSLECPRFRLSCREADWFGANDRTRLQMVSGNGEVNVLRLDPLSDGDIQEILLRNHHIDDPDSFIASARKRGIDELLPNPQSLRMLVAAVAGGRWPETRMETFELACRTLLKEHNPEHRIANPDGADISRLMDVAGRLCAVQLLAGNAGYTLFGNLSCDPGYPGLEQIPGDDRAVLRYTLGTKLFEAPCEGRVAPVHRQVAEFLAARYLARLIADGLPVGRILALMTGHDSVPVAELRGLAAWLAAHSRDSRLELITRDPLGTILYGDVREYPTDEKHRLWECLEREADQKPWFWRLSGMDSRLGDIATPDMEQAIHELLRDSPRDAARQCFVRILLLSLKHGPVVPSISDPVMEIVRDESWSDSVRSAALDALIRQMGNGESPTDALKSLLAAIDAGSVSDSNDDLLGALLTELYPENLSSSEILRYLRRPHNTSLFGKYYSFWSRHVPVKSTTIQCGELLDGITRQFDRLKPSFLSTFGRVIYGRRLLIPLLKRVLESSQEDISPSRVLNWLGVVSDPQIRVPPEEAEFIRNWLSCHPGALKEIIKLGLKICSDARNFRHCMYKIERRVFAAMWPPNWCVEQALISTDENAAAYFICKAADFVHDHPDDKQISRESANDRLTGDNRLLNVFNDRLASRSGSDAHVTYSREQDNEQKRQRQQKWHNHLKTHETTLRENRCHSVLLHQLATIYFGGFVDAEGDCPLDRLRSLLGTDDNLIQAVLEGLHGSIHRSDLPDVAEIIDLGTRDRQHYLALPFMAGLEEAARIAPDRNVSLNEKQMRLALAIHYASPLPDDDVQPPTWFKPLLKARPDLVADVLVESVRPKINSNPHIAADLYELAYCEDHAEVARLASFQLLKMFPVRCRTGQLPALYCLLEAALRHCEQTPLVELIDRKLSYNSMNVGQRIYWLVAGLRTSPSRYLNRLEIFVTEKNQSERRVRYLAEAVAGDNHSPAPIECLDEPGLRLMIQLLGCSHRPYFAYSQKQSEGAYKYTLDMQVSRQIQLAINRLASDPSQSAAEILESLARDDNLIPWRPDLKHAKHRQSDLRREASFQPRDIEQVIQVLDKRRPANAADLAALTTEFLQEIAKNIRHGNTSGWKKYWNDVNHKPSTPKHEDRCRNALLDDLRPKIESLDIDAQPEGRYADDKRADIRVSYGQQFNVPVEIKKSCHRDLWSAIGRQLIAKYTRDPGADGYGIYVVFWFGNTEHCRPTPGEKAPPKSATQLEKRLRDTLSEEKKRKISICVIDVAKPETPSKS